MTKSMLALLLCLFLHPLAYAQLYKGVMKGDTPIHFEIRVTPKETQAYLKVIGLDKGWKGLDVQKAEKGALVLTRPKGDVNITLTDVSADYNKPAGSIYFGSGDVGKGENKTTVHPILLIKNDLKE